MNYRGGLRCLTTQLQGEPALRLIEDLKEKAAKIEERDSNLYF